MPLLTLALAFFLVFFPWIFSIMCFFPHILVSIVYARNNQTQRVFYTWLIVNVCWQNIQKTLFILLLFSVFCSNFFCAFNILHPKTKLNFDCCCFLVFVSLLSRFSLFFEVWMLQMRHWQQCCKKRLLIDKKHCLLLK